MRSGKRQWLIFAAAMAGAGVNARAADPTTQDLLQQIQQLQSKVAVLEAKQATHSSTGTDSSSAAGTSETDSQRTSDAVQRDAAHHSQVLDISNPLTGGWDKSGFVLRSEDGNFSFHPSLVLDFRNDTTYRLKIPNRGGGTDTPSARGDDLQNGFDLTRLRLYFDGTVFKNFSYYVQFQDDQGQNFGLLDAFASYHFNNTPFSLKGGQFKDPIWHERNLSEQNLLAVDRSAVESLIGGGQTARIQGVDLIYDGGKRLRAQAVFHDGYSSLNTKFFDAGGIGAGVGGGAGVTPTNFGTSGRVEYMLIGKREGELHPYTQYDSGFSALGARQDILVLGAGVDYSQAGANDVLFHTVDLTYQGKNGLSLYGAYLGSNRDIHTNQGVARVGNGVYYDAGFVVQAAYLVNQHLEPFARFDYIDLARRSLTGLSSNTVQELTVGANYYLYGQRAKISLDASWLPNGAPADSDALGILRDSGHEEWLLRAQFQLWI